MKIVAQFGLWASESDFIAAGSRPAEHLGNQLLNNGIQIGLLASAGMFFSCCHAFHWSGSVVMLLKNCLLLTQSGAPYARLTDSLSLPPRGKSSGELRSVMI